MGRGSLKLARQNFKSSAAGGLSSLRAAASVRWAARWERRNWKTQYWSQPSLYAPSRLLTQPISLRASKLGAQVTTRYHAPGRFGTPRRNRRATAQGVYDSVAGSNHSVGRAWRAWDHSTATAPPDIRTFVRVVPQQPPDPNPPGGCSLSAGRS